MKMLLKRHKNNITVIDCSSAEFFTVIATAVATSGMTMDQYLLRIAAIAS